jgi:hypothetical protein
MPLIPIFKGYLLNKGSTMTPKGKDIIELRLTPFLKFNGLNFFFVIIGYIINTFIFFNLMYHLVLE